MIIIRPISKNDKDAYIAFSFKSSLGIRNLPKDKERLEEKIRTSEKSFDAQVTKPGREEYLFVLENLATGEIEGTSGIFATINPKDSCAFSIQTIPHPSLNNAKIRLLKLIKPSSRSLSEICSLYVDPTFRHSGQGRLLSLSRFLFMASHRERFNKKVIAELRGFINENQISPFWDAIGRHFCHLSFSELMAQIDHRAIDIHTIIPSNPIYIDLLPQEAQDCIGKTHNSAIPALHMLVNEGFVQANEIDAFEGGPTLIASLSKIRSVQKSKVIKISISQSTIQGETDFIIANTKLNFRACYGKILFKNRLEGIIDREVAEALQVNAGDLVRIVTPHPVSK